MKQIKKVGIVGAGKMGSALAQKFASEGFSVLLADRSLTYVEHGLDGIKETLNEGMRRNIFSAEQVNQVLSRLEGTDNLSDLDTCDLVIEAIFEDFSAKTNLFKELSDILPKNTIIASNTSSFSISELSAEVSHPERFIGLHYFYHAAKNRLVEIVPGAKTSEKTIESAYRFCILSGKDPIFSADKKGFIVNRFFVPWLNEAARLFDEGYAQEHIENICKETFGIGMGPFELMNATGIPVAYHAEKTLETYGELYKVAYALKRKAERNEPWTWEKPAAPPDPQIISEIRDRLLGVTFYICSQILDEQTGLAADIDKGAKTGLRWKKGPVELMRQFGEAEVKRLITATAELYTMPQPLSVGEEFWQTDLVKLEKKNRGVAVITLDQPENLNALSEAMIKQLGEKFDAADKDPDIETILITGSGKAFVAGADIKFFVSNIRKEMICEIEAFTETGQDIFERIDRSEKKVVAIINGLALGGGLELALCADVILALPKASMAFPETGIGIYPGLGGTQRSVQRLGKGLAKYLILTGKAISASEAAEIGLADKVISYDEMFGLLNAEMPVPFFKKKKLPEKWRKTSDFFEKNTLDKISGKMYVLEGLSIAEAEDITRTIRYKAPLALKLAEQLIEEEKGCASELAHLREIFSTSDALLGLTSIGQKVTYEGK